MARNKTADAENAGEDIANAKIAAVKRTKNCGEHISREKPAYFFKSAVRVRNAVINHYHSRKNKAKRLYQKICAYENVCGKQYA